MSEELEAAIGPDRPTFVKRLVLGTAFAAPIVSSFTMSGIEAIFGREAGATTAMSNSNTAGPDYPQQIGAMFVGAAGNTRTFSGPPQCTLIAGPNTFTNATPTLILYRGQLSSLQPKVPTGHTAKSAVACVWVGPDADKDILLTVVDLSVAAGDEIHEVTGNTSQPHPGTTATDTWTVAFRNDPNFVVTTPPGTPTPPPADTPPAGSPATTDAAAPNAVVAGPETTG